MTAPTDHEIPVLCSACRGRAVLRDADIHCDHCGASEPLSADPVAVAAVLRARIAAAASEVPRAPGSLHLFVSVFERPRLAAWASAGLAAFASGLLAVVVAGSLPAWRASSPELRLGAIAAALSGPVMLLAIPTSALVALLAGRWRYRWAVRPYLLARAPSAEREPARCRACDADLGRRSGPVARCRCCATESIVTRDVHASRAALLERERREYLARARGIEAHEPKLPSFVELTMGMTLVGGLLAVWALFLLANVSLR